MRINQLNFKAIFMAILLMCSFTNTFAIEGSGTLTDPFIVTSFPTTISGLDGNAPESAAGMNGSCHTLACCSVYVAKVTLPTYGSLLGENHSFTPLAGSIIAYSADVENVTQWSDITYVGGPGNFCGYRDSLVLGWSYVWDRNTNVKTVDRNNYWKSNATMSDPSLVAPPGDYYILFWSKNNQANIGSAADFTFDFMPFCPDGYSCAIENISICNGDGYTAPSGAIYYDSGNYTDTLKGAGVGGLDSLIFINLSVNHNDYTQDSLKDELIYETPEKLEFVASTPYSTYASFTKSDKNWIECNAVTDDLVDSNRSIFGWVKHPVAVSGSGQVLVGINTSSGGNICNLQIGTNEQLGVYDGSNTHYSGITVTDGEWHFVGYTYDVTTNETKIYVDGSLAGTYTNNQNISSASSTISIGQEFDSGNTTGNFLEGIFTEVSFWNEVLDTDDISAIMNKAIESTHPKYANLKAYYPMLLDCGESTSVIKDYSGNSNDGNPSHSDIQSTDFITIDGFNAAPHYSVYWKKDGNSFSFEDTLVLTSNFDGDYEVEYARDFASVSDDWSIATVDIVISEISYNPPEAGSDSTEFIELYNDGSSTINLEGFQFTSGVAYTFPEASIEAGEHIVVGVNPNAIENTYGYANAFQWTSGGLSNGGEPIVLKDNNGNLVDSLRYDDVAPWPTVTDGGGSTLILCDPDSDNKDGSNWSDSKTSANITVNGKAVYGSPGAANKCIICTTDPGTDEQTACESFTWIDGITYTESNNTAQYTLTNDEGCDSLVTLNLTILKATSGTDVQEACESFTWIDGKTYTESNNTAQYTLTNAAGCDSIVTLDLTISPAMSISFTPFIDEELEITGFEVPCNGYYSGGITANISGGSAPYSYKWSNSATTASIAGIGAGEYEITITDDLGCKVSDKKAITEPDAITGEDVVEICGDSYTWIDGKEYTVNNNTATYTLTSASGCDSVVTLNLTLKTPTSGTDEQTACESFTWIDGKTYTESNNTAQFTLTNAVGCDSVVTLDLTILKASASTDTHIACGSFTWIDGKTYTESNNTATYTIENAAGCDSVITLNLTISPDDMALTFDPFIDEEFDITGFDIQCNGYSSAGITANVTGGIEPYSYEWSNTATTSSIAGIGAGEYEITVTDKAGCTVTDSKLISQPDAITGEDVVEICGESYTWIDGKAYTESNNSATYTLSSASGCDSIVTLNLTLKKPTYRTDVQTACASFTWIDGKTYTESNNTAQYTLTNAEGCDSVITLDLTIETCVTTNAASTIGSVSATLGGDASSATNVTITERGIVYSTSGTPTTADTKIQIGDGVGSFSQEISGLNAATTYNVRAYAITSEGTTYGNEESFTTTKAPQTIAFPAIESKTYGDASFSLGDATTDQGLYVTYTAADPTVVSISGNMASILKAGSTKITASQAGDASRFAASDVEQTLTVSPKAITVTPDTDQSKVYGEDDPSEYTYTYTPELESGDSFTGALIRTSGEDAGSYAFAIGNLSAGDNYDINFIEGNFSISKKAITVTADDVQSKIYREEDPALTYSVTPDLVADDSFNGALSRESGEVVGTYMIEQGTLTAGDNYTINFVADAFTILQKQMLIADPTLTITKVYNGTTEADVTAGTLTNVGETDVTIDATANYDDALVGTNKTIVVTYNASGADASNYIAPEDYVSNLGEITPKSLSISSPDVELVKMYDGDATADIIALGELNGVVSKDESNVTVNGVANYNSADVSSDKTITVDYSLSGTAKENYVAPESDILSDAKILEEIKLTGEEIMVPAVGGCQDEALYIAYDIVSGEPVEYKISFNNAKFTDVAYSALPSTEGKDSIFIIIPNDVQEGIYEATITFRNEINEESTPYTFAFTINLPKSYMVEKYGTLLLANNYDERFVSYQWYKDGVALEGETNQFIYEPDGLSGSYHLEVLDSTLNKTLRTCEEVFSSIISKSAALDVYPNPAQPKDEITVRLHNLSESDLVGAIMSIYNMKGQKVMQLDKVSVVNQIQLPVGNFVGTVNTADGNQYLFKISVVN